MTKIKTLLSKDSLKNLIHPAIYLINIIALIALIIFVNKNVYQVIVIQDINLESGTNTETKDVNVKEFDEIISKINAKKNKRPVKIKEIF